MGWLLWRATIVGFWLCRYQCALALVCSSASDWQDVRWSYYAAAASSHCISQWFMAADGCVSHQHHYRSQHHDRPVCRKSLSSHRHQSASLQSAAPGPDVHQGIPGLTRRQPPCIGHCLSTSAAVLQDHTLKLWDLRVSHDALHVSSVNSQTYPRTAASLPKSHDEAASRQAAAGGPGCLAVFSGHTDPVMGFAIQQGDVIAHAGGRLGVLSLNGPPFMQQFVPTRLSNARGGQDTASLVGLDILPHSRLLVAGTEDGVIKICH